MGHIIIFGVWRLLKLWYYMGVDSHNYNKLHGVDG